MARGHLVRRWAGRLPEKILRMQKLTMKKGTDIRRTLRS